MTRIRPLALQLRRHADAADVALAAGAAVLSQLEIWTSGANDAPIVVLPAAALIATLALAWRRRAPLGSATVALGTIAALSIFWRTDGLWVPLVMVVSLYSVAAHAKVAGALVGGGLGMLGAVLVTLQEDNAGVGQFLGNFLFVALFLVGIPWAAGRTLRARQLRAALLEDRAEALERESEERARAAVAEERLRIARELHDVVGHALGVIVVQAGAERATLASGSGSTRETLVTIEDTGREALDEMRRLLDLMRRDDEAVALAPQPSLANLDALVDSVRAAGLPVDLRVQGATVALPAGVDLSAYRIVQEALTNALKHAGPARARVTVSYGEHGVELEIVDDGPGRDDAGDGGGHGLVGMRERAAIYGGSLRSGARSGGGYEVNVRLPFGTPAA
jgi:signal transduction histidine kinase